MQATTYTLITGASTGLGREFAVQCARRGQNLVLIALPGSHTRSLATNLIIEYGVDAAVFEFDLTDTMEMEKQVTEITARYPVDFLINNAGIGGTVAIMDSSIRQIDRIIQLNVRSTALLTRLLIPHLLQHPASFIMNISSMAAFSPIAWKTVYPASKAFISSFSLGLREELSGTGLSVSVVYPGPIMTNSGTARRLISQGMKGQMSLLSATAIADIAIRKTLAGVPVIIPGRMNRMSRWFMHLLPLELKMKIISREVKKEIPFALSV